MRIAIDYTAAYEQGGGIGRYVRELTRALGNLSPRNQYRLFVSGATMSELPDLPGQNFQWRPTRVTPQWWARLWHRARLPVPVEVFTGSVDIYHATDFTLPPTLPKTRTLLTVHDLSFVRVPESASPKLKAYLDVVVPRSVRRADHVLADSEATKADLIELYATPAEKVTVLLSGVDAHFRPITDDVALAAVRQKYRLPHGPYIFSVGTVQPRKNYARLIAATSAIRQNGSDVSLVIAGGKGWLEDPIYRAIEEHDLAEHVHFIGFADDTDLPALYSASLVTALPSLYEGFGIPVLEAMACGSPVITSNLSSLPEVAGDAAIMVNPYDAEALAEALFQVFTDADLRTSLIQRGLSHAQNFSWHKSAQQLEQIYASLA